MTIASFMRSQLMPLAQLACKFVYRILPAGVCTRIAGSRLGRVLGAWLAPGQAVYLCDFGIKLLLSREDAIISGIAYMGQTNPFETKLVRQYLKPGDTLFQIGAYRDGWLGLVGSLAVGREGSVTCFEPMPEYAESLRKNIALNNSQNILVEQLAVSDARGKAQFSTAANNSSLILTRQSGNVTVETIALDEYVMSRGISRVDFLIVDVEGAEPLVLRGARRTLQTSVSFLLMEVIDDFLRQANSSAEEIIQDVVELGFYPYIITRRGLVAWAPGRTSETLNMFFSKRPLVTNET